MKTEKIFRDIVVVCLVLGVVSGCGRVGRIDEQEQRARLMVSAYDKANEGKYDDAIELCDKALDAYPDFARPNLDIAMLLQDYKKDYVLAIYHYRRYMEMRPSSDKKGMIRDRIKQCRRDFAVEILASTGSKIAESDAKLKSENERLQAQNIKLQGQIANLEKELAKARESIRQEYRDSVVGVQHPDVSGVQTGVVARSAEKEEKSDLEGNKPAAEKPVSGAKKSTSGVRQGTNRVSSVRPEVKSVEAETKQSTNRLERGHRRRHPAGNRSYTVRRGDSLSKIAYRVYRDATMWRRIQKANHKLLGEGVEVKVGQVLTIPWP